MPRRPLFYGRKGRRGGTKDESAAGDEVVVLCIPTVPNFWSSRDRIALIGG